MNDTTNAAELTGMHELIGAVETALATADPAKLKALAETIEAYAHDFPEEYDWALGAQAPVLLHRLLLVIDAMSHTSSESRARTEQLADRKPEGNA
jgi:hypothetical protein